MQFQLSEEEGTFLVKLARKAVTECIKTRNRVHVPENIPEKLLQPCGVFVTINRVENGEKQLRGCIGLPYPTAPLAEAVIESAISSATQDPRFPPLSARELDRIVFEVSVLTPPEILKVERPDEYPAKVRVGEDGLIIEKGMCKGLLLPQVPVEWEWNEEDFLCQCCIKAGLPPDSWMMDGIRIHKFQAIIFEEVEPCGEVKRKIISGK